MARPNQHCQENARECTGLDGRPVSTVLWFAWWQCVCSWSSATFVCWLHGGDCEASIAAAAAQLRLRKVEKQHQPANLMSGEAQSASSIGCGSTFSPLLSTIVSLARPGQIRAGARGPCRQVRCWSMAS